MTLAMDSVSVGIRRGLWPLRLQNAAGMTIPPFSVVRVTGTTRIDGRLVYQVARQDSELHRMYLVTGPLAIFNSGTAEGIGTFLKSGGYVAIESGSPAEGEEWGIAPNSFLLKQHYPGFKINGVKATFGAIDIVPAYQLDAISFWGKANGPIAKDATNGSVHIWTKYFAADTGLTVSNCANYTSAIANDDKVTGTWFSGAGTVAKLVC
jgi:hypothetical protein